MTTGSSKIRRVEQIPIGERPPFVPRIKSARLTDYLMCFYDGRDIDGYPEWIRDNLDMQLGLCCYVIHKGAKAIIFDTMLYREQMLHIDAFLRDMGITSISIVNSHWDCDHVAGNGLYKDRDIIGTNNTRWNLQMHAESLRSGEIWAHSGDPGYPGVKDLTLPNRTFDGSMTLYLDDLKIELHEFFVHQLGSLVAYFPDDRILLAGDACEDSVLFIPSGTESVIPIQVMAYRKMARFEIDKVFPSHGRFEMIANGGYGKDFIHAMIDYKIQLIERLPDPDYASASLESFIGTWVDKGLLAIHEPYRALHEFNVRRIKSYFGTRAALAIPT